MTEYGVFNDEGCIEYQFATLEAAQAAAEAYRADGDEWAQAGEICPDHAEQERDTCELCNSDDDE